MIDHADKTWLREPLVTRTEDGKTRVEVIDG